MRIMLSWEFFVNIFDIFNTSAEYVTIKEEVFELNGVLIIHLSEN